METTILDDWQTEKQGSDDDTASFVLKSLQKTFFCTAKPTEAAK